MLVPFGGAVTSPVSTTSPKGQGDADWNAALARAGRRLQGGVTDGDDPPRAICRNVRADRRRRRAARRYSLIAVVEKDFAFYGDECLHGGGKTLRDGLGLAAGVTNATARSTSCSSTRW